MECIQWTHTDRGTKLWNHDHKDKKEGIKSSQERLGQVIFPKELESERQHNSPPNNFILLLLLSQIVQFCRTNIKPRILYPKHIPLVKGKRFVQWTCGKKLLPFLEKQQQWRSIQTNQEWGRKQIARIIPCKNCVCWRAPHLSSFCSQHYRMWVVMATWRTGIKSGKFGDNRNWTFKSDFIVHGQRGGQAFKGCALKQHWHS